MKLPGNEVHLYFLRPEQVVDSSLLERYESLLSADEKQQMPRFYFSRHRRQYLLTRALVRTCLSRYHDVEPRDWVFATNGYGKPHVEAAQTAPPIRFNISHADGLIICGVSKSLEIGVDVEDSQRSTRAAFNRLSSYFSAAEIRALNQLHGELQKQRFFDYWTLKESYIKARGAGLSIPLRNFSFGFEGNELKKFHIDDELGDNAADWMFWRVVLPPRFRLAIAARAFGASPVLKVFKSTPLQDTQQRQVDIQSFQI